MSLEDLAVSPASRVEQARRHYQALLKNEKFSLDQLHALLEPQLPSSKVAEILGRFRKRDFVDTVEERSDVNEICGIPTCSTSIRDCRHVTVIVNPVTRQFEDRKDRGRYCSDHCFEKSILILALLDNSLPLARSQASCNRTRDKIREILDAEKHDYVEVYNNTRAARKARALQKAMEAASLAVEEDAVKAAATVPISSPKPLSELKNWALEGESDADKASTSAESSVAPQTKHVAPTYADDKELVFLCQAATSDDDDSEDFEDDGGVGAGSTERAREALLRAAPSAPMPTPNDTDSTKSAGERDSTSVQMDPSDSFVRIDTLLRRWVTSDTLAVFESLRDDVSPEGIDACLGAVVRREGERVQDTDDVISGVTFGPVEHQRRVVLQRSLSTFFAQCRFPLVHRRSKRLFDAQMGPTVINIIARTLFVNTARPIPGLQPPIWHLVTMALLNGAGIAAEISADGADERFHRIRRRSKFYDHELQLILSAKYWERQTVKK